MKLALQIISWIAIMIGALAIIGADGDYYAFVGGVLFFTQGLLSILYINKDKK